MDCSMPGFPVLHYLLSQWCYLTSSFSVSPFSSWSQSFPASGSFTLSQLFESGGQSIGASASASVLPMNIQCSFTLGLTGLISLPSKELSESSPTHSSKASVLWRSAFCMAQLSHLYVTTRKTIALMIWNLDSKVISLIFNMLSGFVIAFLPRRKCLLIVHYSNCNLMGKVCRAQGTLISALSPSTPFKCCSWPNNVSYNRRSNPDCAWRKVTMSLQCPSIRMISSSDLRPS